MNHLEKAVEYSQIAKSNRLNNMLVITSFEINAAFNGTKISSAEALKAINNLSDDYIIKYKCLSLARAFIDIGEIEKASKLIDFSETILAELRYCEDRLSP